MEGVVMQPLAYYEARLALFKDDDWLVGLFAEELAAVVTSWRESDAVEVSRVQSAVPMSVQQGTATPSPAPMPFPVAPESPFPVRTVERKPVLVSEESEAETEIRAYIVKCREEKKPVDMIRIEKATGLDYTVARRMVNRIVSEMDGEREQKKRRARAGGAWSEYDPDVVTEKQTVGFAALAEAIQSVEDAKPVRAKRPELEVSEPRYCKNPACGQLLVRRGTEFPSTFANRRTCGRDCAGALKRKGVGDDGNGEVVQ
jgi:hypothetical protein